MEQKTTVYITKYALTRGILKSVGKIERDSGFFYPGDRTCGYATPTQWTASKQEAIKKAEEMRRKKIESLKKQIERIEKLNFGGNL